MFVGVLCQGNMYVLLQFLQLRDWKQILVSTQSEVSSSSASSLIYFTLAKLKKNRYETAILSLLYTLRNLEFLRINRLKMENVYLQDKSSQTLSKRSRVTHIPPERRQTRCEREPLTQALNRARGGETAHENAMPSTNQRRQRTRKARNTRNFHAGSHSSHLMERLNPCKI